MWVDEEQQQQRQQRSSSSSSSSSSCSSKVVLPGEPLQLGDGFLLGLNTHVDNGVARASVCGVVQTVNRLVYVRPLKSRYEANVGDVVVVVAGGYLWISVPTAVLPGSGDGVSPQQQQEQQQQQQEQQQQQQQQQQDSDIFIPLFIFLLRDARQGETAPARGVAAGEP
ncbi:exosome complex exonuclease, putative [Eimeria mitis]|uniref:Exosome complex exonuclease, putative n=1 Tax=Eimeria mitis TaxID=44415 RepID=U6K2S7_9EIME|nr:exosome complex exonuclease, putative [Eimeria mitis]CDJ30073.1 exosome complex exonuclease, putative [Eimeria mitis]